MAGGGWKVAGRWLEGGSEVAAKVNARHIREREEDSCGCGCGEVKSGCSIIVLVL